MMRTRASEWPHGMTATATHDTKRGEDARARLMALAEIPGEWTSAVGAMENPERAASGDRGEMRAPSATFEYMLYQALLGAWPAGRARRRHLLERMQAYALKAAREGKQETSWLNPNQAYESGIAHLHRADPGSARSRPNFWIRWRRWRSASRCSGALNSLSQIT